MGLSFTSPLQLLAAYPKQLPNAVHSFVSRIRHRKQRRYATRQQQLEQAAWQQVNELDTALLEATIRLKIKPPTSIFLTSLHLELVAEYKFKRLAPDQPWQLMHTWDPTQQ